MQNNINKYGVVAVLSIGLLLWAYGMYAVFLKPIKQELKEPNIKISEYSVSGKVMSVNGENFDLKVGRVFVGDNGNYIEYENKSIQVASGTPISITKVVQGRLFRKTGTIMDIKIDENVVVYSDKSIAKDDFIKPTRIEIQKNANSY